MKAINLTGTSQEIAVTAVGTTANAITAPTSAILRVTATTPTKVTFKTATSEAFMMLVNSYPQDIYVNGIFTTLDVISSDSTSTGKLYLTPIGR